MPRRARNARTEKNAQFESLPSAALVSQADIRSARSLLPTSYLPLSSFMAWGLAATLGLVKEPSREARVPSSLAISDSICCSDILANFCGNFFGEALGAAAAFWGSGLGLLLAGADLVASACLAAAFSRV